MQFLLAILAVALAVVLLYVAGGMDGTPPDGAGMARAAAIFAFLEGAMLGGMSMR